MNTHLVDSIVQLISNLPLAERELVQQKLITPRQQEVAENTKEITLDDRRRDSLRQPLAQRKSLLAKQAQQMLPHYQFSAEWRELMAGDIIDD
jgi:hypothetical protein